MNKVLDYVKVNEQVFKKVGDVTKMVSMVAGAVSAMSIYLRDVVMHDEEVALALQKFIKK